MPQVNAYYQATEPSDLTPATRWYKDDGKLYIRKIDLTWNYAGEWQQPNLNHVHVEGATMLGPLLGNHGLAPLESPAFTGVATLNDIDLADKQWVSDQLTALQTTLNNTISNQIGGTTGNITIGSNMAVGYGTVADGGTIPLPVYSDNVRATKAQVWGVLVSMKSVTVHDGSEANDSVWEVSADVNLVVTANVNESHWGAKAGVANYIIICKR